MLIDLLNSSLNLAISKTVPKNQWSNLSKALDIQIYQYSFDAVF